MIDLHTHTIFSDGELGPSELVMRGIVKGYQAIAITDHGDASNLDLILPRMVKVSKELEKYWGIKVIPGIELTHVPPKSIKKLTVEARNLGARIVIVHGETIVEPVPENTNYEAVNASIDVLAHPGLIGEAIAEIARDRGIMLEISARKGHSFTNGHVVNIAKRVGASLIINSDAHSPNDLLNEDLAKKIACGAGLTEEDFFFMQDEALRFVEKISSVSSST
ncbi:MAG: histidinol phosphate phosphatase domain-containing protein [Thermodesulfobacteriota bacterium]|nr:histidinol phosphate phosphatase domain-containing protein [Thermodesulfobacteriota bacterium]